MMMNIWFRQKYLFYFRQKDLNEFILLIYEKTADFLFCPADIPEFDCPAFRISKVATANKSDGKN
jgi:hypothetical protein